MRSEAKKEEGGGALSLSITGKEEKGEPMTFCSMNGVRISKRPSEKEALLSNFRKKGGGRGPIIIHKCRVVLRTHWGVFGRKRGRRPSFLLKKEKGGSLNRYTCRIKDEEGGEFEEKREREKELLSLP